MRIGHRSWRAAVAIALIAFTAGCFHYRGPRPGIIYVSIGPPAPLVEVIVASPGSRHVWRPGHWRWDGGRYVWVGGVWIALEPGRREWIPGRWVRDRHGWYWVEGRWR